MPADLDQSSAPASKTKFWNDPDNRALFFQAIIVILVVGTIGHFVNNALVNLETRGITTGFGFLSQSSGFDILLTLIPYDATYTFGRTFIVGLLNTLLVGFLGVVLATILGFIMGVARLSNNWLISKLAMCYIETFRNIPLLLQIFFWYVAVLGPLPGPRQSIEIGSAFLNNRGFYTPAPVFESGFWFVVVAFFAAVAFCWYLARWNHRRQDKTGQQFPIFWSSVGLLIAIPLIAYFFAGSPMSWDYPELKGFNFKGGNVIIPELTALLLALTIYTAAFIAEIVRSGIEAVNKGQTEASHALGINNAKTLRLIVIPQALRVIIPPLTSQYLNLIKNSSLATAIGYPDLVAVFMGTTLNQTGQAIEIIFMTMAVYLTISLLVSAFMNWYNKIMALAER